MTSTGATLMIVGSAVFLVGAAVGVPRVFTESDPQLKVRMIEERLTSWRAAQPLYAGGSIVAALGAGSLASGARAGSGATLFLASGVLLMVGALCWSWFVTLRTVGYRAFALGQLPSWPFATYVLLTIAGLALLGIALLVSDFPTWLGWLTLVADAAYLAAYLRFGDIPPAVFYLLLGVVGVTVL